MNKIINSFMSFKNDNFHVIPFVSFGSNVSSTGFILGLIDLSWNILLPATISTVIFKFINTKNSYS